MAKVFIYINEDGELINFVNEAADKLFSNAGGEEEKKKTKELMTESLAAKEKQKNLPISATKTGLSKKTIAITLGVIAAIGLISYVIYRSNKKIAQ